MSGSAAAANPRQGKMNGSLEITRGPEQHPHRFADYFVICGLDKDSGLEPDKYFGEYSRHSRFPFTRRHRALVAISRFFILGIE